MTEPRAEPPIDLKQKRRGLYESAQRERCDAGLPGLAEKEFAEKLYPKWKDRSPITKSKAGAGRLKDAEIIEHAIARKCHLT